MQNSSEIDEQKGLPVPLFTRCWVFCNPVTHEFNWVDDPELALELISFAQHLLRKAKAARVNPVRQAWATLPPTMPTMNS
jgi:hypothetical protein